MKKKMEYKWTDGQKRAMEDILSGRNVCILGRGGTGKSALIESAVESFQEQKKNVLLCAQTGTAAENINGMTINRLFGFPAGPAITTQGKLMTRAPKVIRSADVIIMDEVSMCAMDLFDAVTVSIQKANQSKESGKKDIQFIVLGDFCQLPPVVKDEERPLLRKHYQQDVGKAFAFMGDMWEQWDFKYDLLTKVIRQNDPEFARALQKLRTGNVSCIDYLNSMSSDSWMDDAITLCPKRWKVRQINDRMLKNLAGREYICDAYFTGALSKEDIPYTAKSLHIKEGMRIMFTANDIAHKYAEEVTTDIKRSNAPLYYNGDIGTVLQICVSDDPEKEELMIAVNGKIINLVRQDFRVFEYVVRKGRIGTATKGTYLQFPIMPAYACTIHKAQGKTLERVNIDPDCFAEGQLYVALSRCKDIRKVYLTRDIRPEDIIVNREVIAFYRRISGMEGPDTKV